MIDSLEQSFPLSNSLLLIPLALEGRTSVRPQRYTKVVIAGERENALRQRLTVSRLTVKPQSFSLSMRKK